MKNRSSASAPPIELNGSAPAASEAVRVLKSLSGRSRWIGAHQTMLHEHDRITEVYLIQQGWSFLHKLLPNGARQVVGFPLPGDIVGFSDIATGRASASLECLSDVIYLPISITAINDAMVSDGRVGQAFLTAINQTHAITVEHLVNTGRRNALARTAHIILEFASRLDKIGVSTDQGFELPVSQNVLADALGLTAIHLNRVLRQLREANLVTFRGGVLTIHDKDVLAEIASFMPDYLECS